MLAATDRTLVRRALEGDTAAVERLVFRYENKAHAIARAIVLRSPVQVEDVVQEAFFQALRDLHSLRQPDRFGAWFLRIVRNVAHGRLSERSPVPSRSLHEVAVTVPDEVEFQELRSSLWREVAALPQSVREAMFLFYHEGGSVRSVAATLGISRAATKKRLQKGRNLLRATMFRKFREHLRESSPTPTERRRRARRTALLACALPSLPGHAAVAALVGASSAGSVPSTGGAFAALGSLVLAAAAALAKNISVTFGILLLTSVAAVATLAIRSHADNEPALPERGRESALSLPRYARPVTTEDHEDANLDLGSRLEVRDRRRVDHTTAEPRTESPPAESSSRLDFSRYSALFAQNLSLLGPQRSGDLSAGERASLSRLRRELLRIVSQAKNASEHPLFDADLFGGLLSALFRDGLDLSAEQVAKLEGAKKRFFDSVPENPGELDPLERLWWRERMADHFWNTIDELLDDKQGASWPAVREYTEQFFDARGVFSAQRRTEA